MGNAIREALNSESKRAVVVAVRDLAGRVERGLERSFEVDGCSCKSDREDLEALEEERDRKIEEIRESYEGRIATLEAKISVVDRREHPALDREARAARAAIVPWLLERVIDGATPFDVQDESALRKEYVAAWRGGWRPKIGGNGPRREG